MNSPTKKTITLISIAIAIKNNNNTIIRYILKFAKQVPKPITKAIAAPIMILIPIFRVFDDTAAIIKPTKQTIGLAISMMNITEFKASDIKAIFFIQLNLVLF